MTVVRLLCTFAENVLDQQLSPIKVKMDVIQNNNKSFILTVRLGKEEEDMVKSLKGHPYYVNMAEYLRATIRHLYDSRTNKAGRPK